MMETFKVSNGNKTTLVNIKKHVKITLVNIKKHVKITLENIKKHVKITQYIFGDIECHLDLRQSQQHRAFNRHLDGH